MEKFSDFRPKCSWNLGYTSLSNIQDTKAKWILNIFLDSLNQEKVQKTPKLLSSRARSSFEQSKVSTQTSLDSDNITSSSTHSKINAKVSKCTKPKLCYEKTLEIHFSSHFKLRISQNLWIWTKYSVTMRKIPKPNNKKCHHEMRISD